MYFGIFTNVMQCERGKQDFSNKVIVQEIKFQYNWSISITTILYISC